MATEKRLIRADVTADAFTKWLTSTYDGRMPVDIVNEIPTVDAVEVVRCEKCRYYEKAEYDEGYKMVCRLLKRQTASDGFCYCGERKSNVQY